MDPYKMGLRPTSPTRPITPDCSRSKHFPKLGMWQHIKHLFNRDGSMQCIESEDQASCTKSEEQKLPKQRGSSSARPVGVGLPRQATFKRQNSEKRERLCLVEPLNHERRAYSSSRPVSTALTHHRSNSLPTSTLPGRRSAPAVANIPTLNESARYSFDASQQNDEPTEGELPPTEYDRQRPLRPASVTSSTDSDDDQMDYFEDRNQLNRELDTRWILNLSMHFRDKSDREKFFVTYAETPTKWRRVTVSCDYRNPEPDSLEVDLKELQQQREKSMQIYEAIRDSLTGIKFYDTVTNLKLETSNGRLHVHVTEDINEIIPYPPISSLHHVLQDMEFQPRVVRESELSFEAHLSGFVYRVQYRGKLYIKKEIPGPDTVDEFLYEVNALHALQDSACVINLEAIVTDENGQLIKGLLIEYAERGAVVDLLYDYKDEIPWESRERWARHAIQGLSDIHEEGYVQGDFTLSNIVVNADSNARIIDINRRGCPVGWEPPEIAKKIASNQRISMYIGQKSDLYQLGMTLWALAMDDDEPERHDPPLSTQEFPTEVPEWYQEIVRICLSPRPRDRLAATELLRLFPSGTHVASWSTQPARPAVRIRTEKQYINPLAAVERDDIERFGHGSSIPDEDLFSPKSSGEDNTHTWPQSSSYDKDGDSASSSHVERPRGRRRVSDHDLLLRAHRQDQAMIDYDNDFYDENFESPPIVTISSDGRETHVIENGENELQDISSYQSPRLQDMAEPESPILSPPLSYVQHFQDRRLFPGYSETSEDTPRNSSFELFGPTEGYNSGSGMARSRSRSFPGELAGLGGHPNVSVHSLPPALTFADSGYDEPSVFGADLDCEEDNSQHKVMMGHLESGGFLAEQKVSRDQDMSSACGARLNNVLLPLEEHSSEMSCRDEGAKRDTESVDFKKDSRAIIEVVTDPVPTNVDGSDPTQTRINDISGKKAGIGSDSSGIATPDSAISRANALREAYLNKSRLEAIPGDVMSRNRTHEDAADRVVIEVKKNADEQG